MNAHAQLQSISMYLHAFLDNLDGALEEHDPVRFNRYLQRVLGSFQSYPMQVFSEEAKARFRSSMGDMLDALGHASGHGVPAPSPALMQYPQPSAVPMQDMFPPTGDIVMDATELSRHSAFAKAPSLSTSSSAGANPSPASSTDSSSDVSTSRPKSNRPKSKTPQRGRSPSAKGHSSRTPTPKAKRPRVSERENEPSKRAKTGSSTRTVNDSMASQQSSSSNRASKKDKSSSSENSKSFTAPSPSTTPTRTKAASTAKTPSTSRKVEKKRVTSPTVDRDSHTVVSQSGVPSAVSTQAALKGKGRVTATHTRQLYGPEITVSTLQAAAKCAESFGLPTLRASKQMCLDAVYEA